MKQKQFREINLNNLSPEDALAISVILTHAFQIVGAWDAEHGDRLNNMTWEESDIELGKIKAIKQTLRALQARCEKKAEKKGYSRFDDNLPVDLSDWCNQFQYNEAQIISEGGEYNMKLNFAECQASGANILADLGRFNRVHEYLSALADATENNDREAFNFFPNDCGYKDPATKELKWVIQSGYVTSDARENIEHLSKKPGWITLILNDNLNIDADAFEQECFFSWGTK